MVFRGGVYAQAAVNRAEPHLALSSRNARPSRHLPTYCRAMFYLLSAVILFRVGPGTGRLIDVVILTTLSLMTTVHKKRKITSDINYDKNEKVGTHIAQIVKFQLGPWQWS